MKFKEHIQETVILPSQNQEYGYFGTLKSNINDKTILAYYWDSAFRYLRAFQEFNRATSNDQKIRQWLDGTQGRKLADSLELKAKSNSEAYQDIDKTIDKIFVTKRDKLLNLP